MRIDRTWLDVAGQTRFERSALRKRLTAGSQQWVVMLWRVYARVFEVVGKYSCIPSLSTRDLRSVAKAFQSHSQESLHLTTGQPPLRRIVRGTAKH